MIIARKPSVRPIPTRSSYRVGTGRWYALTEQMGNQRALRFVAAVAPLVASCSGSGDSASPPSGGVASECAAIVNTAPIAHGSRVASAPPSPTGGTVSNGTYWLSTWIDYTGSGGEAGPSTPTHRSTLRIETTSSSNGSIAWVDSLNGAAEVLTGGEFTISGADLTIAAACPSGLGTIDATYSSPSPTEFRLGIELSDGTYLVSTFARQSP